VKSADAKINSASVSRARARAAFLEGAIINHLNDYNGSRHVTLYMYSDMASATKSFPSFLPSCAQRAARCNDSGDSRVDGTNSSGGKTPLSTEAASRCRGTASNFHSCISRGAARCGAAGRKIESQTRIGESDQSPVRVAPCVNSRGGIFLRDSSVSPPPQTPASACDKREDSRVSAIAPATSQAADGETCAAAF